MRTSGLMTLEVNISAKMGISYNYDRYLTRIGLFVSYGNTKGTYETGAAQPGHEFGG